MPGGRRHVRGQRQLRGQADAALAADGQRRAGPVRRLETLAARGRRRADPPLVAARPDLTIEELRVRLAALGIPPGARADAKKKTRHAAEQERPDVAAARVVWRTRQAALSHERLVFVDETWATTNTARRLGRARRGQRVVAAVPPGHWKTTTFLAALRHDGIAAPCVFDGAINGARFLAHVEQALAPTLRPATS